VILWALLVCSISQSQEVNQRSMIALNQGTNATADPAQIYRNFLATRPWIKQIDFRMDRNYEIDATDPSHPERKQGLATYKAAIQPNGYYLEHLQGSLLYDNPPGLKPSTRVIAPGNETISGASTQFFWRIWEGTNGMALVPRDNTPGASSKNWLRHSFNYEIGDVNKILRLGFDKLSDGSLNWIDNDHFKAIGLYGKQAEGVIRQYTNGLPRLVDYSIYNSSNEKFIVQYAYKPGRPFPPYQIIVQDINKKVTHTNYIDDIQIGLDLSATNGFLPEMFRPKIMAERVSLSSNSVLYQVGQNGEMKVLSTTYDPTLFGTNPAKRQTLSLIILLNIFFFFIGFAIWRKQKTNKIKELK
jgi:hypothetical protein